MTGASAIDAARGACALSLRLGGWLALTVLASLGCFVLFFAALGDLTLIGFFGHLANLSTRFGEASPERQVAFSSQLASAWLVVALIVGALRVRSLPIPYRERIIDG